MIPRLPHDPRDRTAAIGRLRAAIETRASLAAPVVALALGAPPVDAALPGGGLAAGHLHEIAPAEEADGPAALGFLAALLALAARATPGDALIAGIRGAAGLHGHGLAALGLDPNRLLLLDLDADADVLWALAEALRAGLTVAAGLLAGPLGLTESRRLHLAAEAAGAVLLVLRPAAADRPNAAATRWRIAAAPAGRDEFGLLARARWRVALERCRNGRPGGWLLEWDHAAHRFDLAAGLADPAPAPEAPRVARAARASGAPRLSGAARAAG